MLREGQIYRRKDGTVITIKRIYKDTRFLAPPSPGNPLLDFVDIYINGELVTHYEVEDVVFSLQRNKFKEINPLAPLEWD